MRAETAEHVLKLFLMIVGGLAALAVVPMMMPTAWMEGASEWLGLEPLPRQPLTEYLTRSLSAVYAMTGLLVIYIAQDVRRYRELVIFVGWLTGALGVALTAIDFRAGMPASWSWAEGPPTVACAFLIIWLGRKVRPT